MIWKLTLYLTWYMGVKNSEWLQLHSFTGVCSDLVFWYAARTYLGLEEPCQPQHMAVHRKAHLSVGPSHRRSFGSDSQSEYKNGRQDAFHRLVLEMNPRIASAVFWGHTDLPWYSVSRNDTDYKSYITQGRGIRDHLEGWIPQIEVWGKVERKSMK